ncbi:MAG: DUF4041 domain-containing protein [candidate division WOR-3 bacterium]|nr:DUF4041 domain-containing protein [candidate division WOR-3 bacterium]
MLIVAILAFVLAACATVFLIMKLSQCRKDTRMLRDRYRGIIDRDEEIRKRESKLSSLQASLEELAKQHGSRTAALNDEYAKHKAIYDSLQAEIAKLEESVDLQSYGVYKPHYDFATSDEYRAKLEAVVEVEKDLIKLGHATACSTKWTVGGSTKEGERMTKLYSKLMLRAFNGECDAAVSKARWNNINVMEERISRAFDAINKLGSSHHIVITDRYRDAKHDELRLVYEYQEKLHQEKEEQRRIQEEMREEERVQREAERAREDAEKEETYYQKALVKARAEMAAASGKEVEDLNAKIGALEVQLKTAQELKARAISRAQITKSGHVYVISNVGSFGEDMFKVGMTRRLEPIDRVHELGDASVPFAFDVHAMIYSDNAPKVEQTLHAALEARRVNLVNDRKEFFHVSLPELETIAEEKGLKVEFTKLAEAREYRETLALRIRKSSADQPTPQPDKFPDALVPAA